MESTTSDLLLISIFALIAGHAAFTLHQRRWLAFDPLNTFWAGVLVCYLLQPLLYSSLIVRWNGLEVYQRTLMWIAVSVLFVIVGYESRLGSSCANYLPSLPSRLDPKRCMIVASALLGLGALGYGYMVASAGSLRAWLAVGRGGTKWSEVSAYAGSLSGLVPVGVMLLLFHVQFHKVTRVLRMAAWALGGLLLLWFVYLGSRSRTIAFGLLLMSAWYLPSRRNPPKWLLAAAFVTIFLLTNFITAFRDQFTDLSFHLDDIDWQLAQEEFMPGRIQTGRSRRGRQQITRGMEFNCVATIVRLVPDRVPYNRGYCLLEFVTRPIPRAIWPTKRYPALEAAYPILSMGQLSSVYVTTTTRRLLMGPAFTFTGYWYAIGGPLAIILAGILTGAFFRLLRSIYDRDPGNEGDVVLFANLVIIGFGEAAGTPLGWIINLPDALLPVLIAIFLCRARTPHGAKVATR